MSRAYSSPQTAASTTAPAAQDPAAPAVEQPYGNAAVAEAVRSGDGRATLHRSGADLSLRLWDFEVRQAALRGGHVQALADLAGTAAAEVEAGAVGWTCEEIVGHASPEGEEDHNLALSQARARAVLAAMDVRGTVAARGEAEGAGAPASLWPWYRAVDIQVRILGECDAQRVSELEAEIAALEEEIEALRDKVGQARGLGEEAADDGCGSGSLPSEDKPLWRTILENAAPDPEPWGEARCIGGDEFRKAQERRADRLEEQVGQLEAERDDLGRQLDGVE